jgi:hypothetical protein
MPDSSNLNGLGTSMTTTGSDVSHQNMGLVAAGTCDRLGYLVMSSSRSNTFAGKKLEQLLRPASGLKMS